MIWHPGGLVWGLPRGEFDLLRGLDKFVPMRDSGSGPQYHYSCELVIRSVCLGRERGDSRGVPRLEGRDSVQDPLANTASKARSVVLPGLGRRTLGLSPLPIDVPWIVLIEDWSKIVRQGDVIKGRDEWPWRRVV